MTHEWKVGDRFNRTITVSTDYEITRIDEKFVYLSDGKNIVIWPLFYLDDVTPLIPATPEPQKLDVTKPIREKATCMVLEYLTTDIIGTIWTKTPSGNVQAFQPSDLENIPIPKIKGRREVVLLDSCAVTFADALSVAATKYIVGRAWVEIEAGDGMGEG